jgi:hypothetical protein
LLTQPLHNSSPYGSTREEQQLVEDHQHDRPEPTSVKEFEKSLPSDYTRQILSEPQSFQKEQKSQSVYDTHYVTEPYEDPTVASVYDEKDEEYNITVLVKGVTPSYAFATPILVPELLFPNRRLRLEYIPRLQAQYPQELYNPLWAYVGSDQESEYVPRLVKLQVNGHPQHRPQVMKYHGAIYHYFLVENETKNKYSPQENAANKYNQYHELSVQDGSQTKDAT